MAPVGGDRARVLLRGYRRAAGLTQSQLAALAGVSIGVVRDLEQGRSATLQGRSALAIARALGLDTRQAGRFLAVTQVQPTRGARPQPRAGSALAASGGPASAVRVSVLGPLAVWRGGRLIHPGPPARQAVLGLLALSPNQLVHREILVDLLWEDNPPATAVTQVQAHVSRLRRTLEPGASQREPGGRLVCTGSAYQLHLGVGELDLLEFGDLTRRAQSAASAGEQARACSLYEEALGLWRGEPLVGIDALRRHPAVVGLAGQRADATVAYAQAACGLGLHDRALAAIGPLTREEPLHERARAVLMIALAASGRQAAALESFADIRRRLDEQLGVLPCAELADAHQRVLRGDLPQAGRGRRHAAPPGLSPLPVPGRRWPGAAHQPMPRQLPPAPPQFAGRDAELAALTGLLGHPGYGAPGTVMVGVIGGAPGAGKTALAVHWAHEVADRFPDGQLFADLLGYGPGRPMPTADALARFLRALGVPGQDIPPEVSERADQYRSLTAGRRMLMVLDNAASEEQVRPLLPGTGTCAVVVTSRDALAGLVARDGAVRVEADPLPARDAVRLLRMLIGTPVDAEPGAARTLADQCGRLPLALRVAAELATARPAASLGALVDELADQRRRLDLLDADGDPRAAVRAVFSWSYRRLEPGTARAFRLMGLHPGVDLDAEAVAALTGATAQRSGPELERLARAHLVSAVGPGRFRVHDLLRSYARELAAAEDGEDLCRAALARLLDHYLHTAAVAMDALFPGERWRRPSVGLPAGTAAPVAGTAAARAWLDTQRASLVAVTVHAAENGWPDHAARLAATVFRYLEKGGHYTEAVAVHTHALRAAQRVADRSTKAEALTNLGVTDLHQGRYRQAAENLQRALLEFRQLGNAAGEARSRHNLGLAHFRLGHYRQAAHHLDCALVLFQHAGITAEVIRTRTSAALLALRLGHDEQAAGHLEQALLLCRENSRPAARAYVLAVLGYLSSRHGRHEQAIGRLREALAILRETGHRRYEACILDELGRVLRSQGLHEQALEHHALAFALHLEMGSQPRQARALAGMGAVLRASGQYDRACESLRHALDIATRTGDRYQQARARDGLAFAYQATGHLGQARRSWGEALSLYSELGVTEADRVRAQLTATGNIG